ncbi:Homocysteine S-methyltransferase [Zopfochytrium polystomum]|nr:Homocysteine S-methyltransferase [Zopfochytrium polystomum]
MGGAPRQVHLTWLDGAVGTAVRAAANLCPPSDNSQTTDGVQGPKAPPLDQPHRQHELRAERYDEFNCVEALCLTRPLVVTQVHRAYIDAGARVVKTNTFCANRLQLAKFGLAHLVPDINRTAVTLVREAAASAQQHECWIAGSVGPTEILLSTIPADDNATRDAVRLAYEEQITALVDAGIDILLVETVCDLSTCLAALDAAEKVVRTHEAVDRRAAPTTNRLPASPPLVWAPSTGGSIRQLAVVVSFTPVAGGRSLVSGEPLAAAVAAVYDHPLARRKDHAVHDGGESGSPSTFYVIVGVGVNCGSGLRASALALSKADPAFAAASDGTFGLGAAFGTIRQSAENAVSRSGKRTLPLLLSCCPSAGLPTTFGGEGYVPPEIFAEAATLWLRSEGWLPAEATSAVAQRRQDCVDASDESASSVHILVGGCCGTAPNHIGAAVAAAAVAAAAAAVAGDAQ